MCNNKNQIKIYEKCYLKFCVASGSKDTRESGLTALELTFQETLSKNRKLRYTIRKEWERIKTEYNLSLKEDNT